MEEFFMQKNYGRNQIPDLRKKSGIMEYFDISYLDAKSCLLIFTILMIFIVSIMAVAAIPNTNIF